jgi:hypothetical protein
MYPVHTLVPAVKVTATNVDTMAQPWAPRANATHFDPFGGSLVPPPNIKKERAVSKCSTTVRDPMAKARKELFNGPPSNRNEHHEAKRAKRCRLTDFEPISKPTQTPESD